MRPKLTASVLWIGAFLFIVLLASWIIGPEIFALFLLCVLFLSLVYSLNWGRLSKALPNVGTVDYAAFLIMVLIVCCFLFIRVISNDGYRIIILVGTIAAWGMFCVLRYPSIRAGATLSLPEALWGEQWRVWRK